MTSESLAGLLSRITDKTCRVGIIGLGYVGLPLVIRFAEAGFPVTGFDIDPDKAKLLNAGKSYIDHIDDSLVAGAVKAGFEATVDFSRASEADALLICVPTPLGAHREPDLSFVIKTVEAIQPYLRAGQMVALESTTYPGTTTDELLPRVSAGGLEVGSDLFLVYSPEREDPGNPNFTTRTIPKVVGGHTAGCLEAGLKLYESVIDQVVPVSSTEVAEMTKLLENIHRAVNIGLVNEIKMVCDRMGINIYEVIDAASTKPFGFVPYYPGPGLGGHCIPIDPFYLTWKARQYGLNTRFIELAGEVNSQMPEWVIEKTVLGLNDHSKAVKGSCILVLGIAYKKNVDDTRESPSIEIMELLRERGAEVAFSDPYISVFPKMREYEFDLSHVELTPQSLGSYDCVIVGTDHDNVDYDLVAEHAKLIIDTRGRYRAPRANVVRA